MSKPKKMSISNLFGRKMLRAMGAIRWFALTAEHPFEWTADADFVPTAAGVPAPNE